MTDSLTALSTRRTIAVRNRIEELNTVYTLVEAVTQEAGLPETLGRTLLLVSEELFCNIVRYGYPPETEDVIEFTLECGTDRIVLTFVDHAIAFDVSKDPSEPIDLPLEEMQPGGLGLFLVHHFAQSLRNWRDGDANITEVIVARQSGDA